MKRTCPVCGKAFWCDFPDLWVFKRNGQFICSYGCTRSYDRKEASEMYNKTKKDGSQARKPGPKKPEGNITVVATKEPPKDDDIGMEKKTKNVEYKVTGIATTAGDFQYYKKDGILDWTTLDGTSVSMNVDEWKEFMTVFPVALFVLGVKM